MDPGHLIFPGRALSSDDNPNTYLLDSALLPVIYKEDN